LLGKDMSWRLGRGFVGCSGSLRKQLIQYMVWFVTLSHSCGVITGKVANIGLLPAIYTVALFTEM